MWECGFCVLVHGISFTVDVSIPKSAFEGEARSRGSTILETMPGSWSARCERGARATFRNAGIRESNGELPSSGRVSREPCEGTYRYAAVTLNDRTG